MMAFLSVKYYRNVYHVYFHCPLERWGFDSFGQTPAHQEKSAGEREGIHSPEKNCIPSNLSAAS